MDAVVLIPARLGSVRFPRKVLASATGRPLIRHVYEAAARAGARVVVAADSAEIVDAVAGFGGEAVLTGDHDNGTARLAEASRLLGLPDSMVVVNVQGDEPEIEPEVIEASMTALLADPGYSIGTVASPIDDEAMWRAPSVVKAVVGRLVEGVGRALYFSRSPVPFDRDGDGGGPRWRHVGIYAYRVGFLQAYAALEPTPLEQTERLEQLRALEHGYEIGVAIRRAEAAGIDTPEDYERFVERWQAR